jgi:hypothetical protein
MRTENLTDKDHGSPIANIFLFPVRDFLTLKAADMYLNTSTMRKEVCHSTSIGVRRSTSARK